MTGVSVIGMEIAFVTATITSIFYQKNFLIYDSLEQNEEWPG